ncbi:MAG: hypothetical protein KDD36_08150, partial [Flavobacteriales bacterium]|nr:hypothetical protein [Flavobacteriales bacterium]
VEGLYLAAKLATKLKNNEPIRDRIADQKSSLQNLIGLLEENKADEQVMNILTQLKELEEVFANMETEDQGEVTATTDTEGGVTTIGGGSVLKLTDAQVNLIHEKISAIRNGIISVN